MDHSLDAVFMELQAIRRGWGLRSNRARRLGPALTELLEPRSDDRPLFDVAVDRLSEAADQLPEPHRSAALVALGIHPSAQLATLDERRDWLANESRFSPRTASRRMDDALRLLAQRLLGALNETVEWHFRRFEAVLSLNTSQPEAMEYRTVVVTHGQITEVETSISVSRHPDDDSPGHRIDVDLLYGGRLTTRDTGYESLFEQSILLSEPLVAGREHRYAVRVRVPADQPMAPHYVYVPLRRCDSFDLRILFDMRRIPESIWRLDGVPTAVIYEGRPRVAEAVVPDTFGEVHTAFDNPVVGLSYGICWAWQKSTEEK